MWRPGWHSVTVRGASELWFCLQDHHPELVLVPGVTPRVAQPRPPAALGIPSLTGAAAPTFPPGSALGDSVIAVRIPQSICLGGRPNLPAGNHAIPDLGEKILLIRGNPRLSTSPTSHVRQGCAYLRSFCPVFCPISGTKGGSLFPWSHLCPGGSFSALCSRTGNAESPGS